MKKTKLYFKKSLSVFLAVLMLVSAWVFVAPENAGAATVQTRIDLAGLTSITDGTGSRGSSSQITVCSDGEIGNTTVGNAKFNIEALPSEVTNVTLHVDTTRNSGTAANSTVKFYMIDPNKCYAPSSTYVYNNISAIYGGNYSNTTGITSAYNYYGINESQALGTIVQTATGDHTFDVTAAVNTAKANGWTELCLVFIMPSIYKDTDTSSWSDIHIQRATTYLDCTYEADALSAADVSSLNTAALNSIPSFNTAVTTITDLNWAYNGDNQDNEPNVYKNILYSSDCNVVTANTGSVNLKDSGAATIQWYHGVTTFLYDGITTPQTGVMVCTIPRGSSYNIRTYSSYISSGSGLNLAHMWYGSDGRANFMWVISAPGNTGAATKDGSVNSTNAWTVNSSTWLANKLQFTGSMSNTEYYRDITVTWGWKGNQKSQDTGTVYTYTATSGNHIYVVNYVPLRNALEEALGTGTYSISNLKNNTAKYTPASVAEYVAAVNALVAAKPNNYVNASTNNYTGYANAASAAVTRFNNAKANLTLQKYEVKFESFDGTVVYEGEYNYGAALDVDALVAGYENTASTPCTGSDAENYHNTFTWPKSGLKNIVDNVTVKEVKSASVSSHSFGTPALKDDTYHTITCTECGYVKQVQHQWSSGEITTQPNCEVSGVKTFTCAGCSSTIEQDIPANGHSFNSGIYLEKETGENGSHYQKCENCSKYGTGVTEGKTEAHIWVEESRENAKCEEDGSVTYKCSVCGSASYVGALEQTGHQHITAFAAKEISGVCNQIGWSAYWRCDDCGKIWLDEARTNELTDIADNNGNDVPDAIEIKNVHKFDGAWISASSGENGEHYRMCSICRNAYGLNGVENAKEAHSWDDGTVTVASTCEKEGVKTYKCTLCPQTYTEVVGKAAHTMTKTEAKAADCNNPGNNAYYYCSECNKYYKDEAGSTVTTVEAEKIKALDHTFKAGNTDENHPETDKVIKAATCQAAAVYRVTCDRCGTDSDLTYSYGSADTVNGHKFEGAIKNNADGSHSYKCTVEGCEEYGLKTTCIYEVIKDVPSTCKTPGYTSYKCKTCGNTYTETKALDFNNHTGEGTYVIANQAATCATLGSTGIEKCSGCNATLSTKLNDIPLDSSNHENMIDYDGQSATCQAAGWKAYRYCDKCGVYAVAKEEIAQKQHKFTAYTSNGNGSHTAECDTCAEGTEKAISTQSCSGGKADCVTAATCTVCKAAYGNVDSATHKRIEVMANVPATCQTEGTVAYRKCTACGTDIDTPKKIATIPHTLSSWTKLDTEDKHTRYCLTCVDTETLDVYTETAPCNGGTAYCDALATCVDCKKAYGVTNPENHSTTASTLKDVVAATCQSKGFSGNYRYNCCNEIKTAGAETEALAHSFDIVLSSTAATCISTGHTEYKCSTCVEGEGVTAATYDKLLDIDSKNHASKETITVNAVAATCESDGKTGDVYHKCCYDAEKTDAENRKALISKGTVIKANGQHVYGEAVAEYLIKEITETRDDEGKLTGREIVLVDAEPSYKAKTDARHEDGKWYHAAICEICYELKYSPCYTYEHTYNCVDTDICEECSGLCSLVDANKHKADLVIAEGSAVEATCVSDGSKGYYECADCNKTYFDEAGKKPFDPDNAEHQKALVISKATVGHKLTDAPEIIQGTCGEAGSKKYKCTVEDCDYVKEVSTGLASDKHTWNTEYSIVKEATCAENGRKVIKCTVCDKVKANSTVTIPATGEHDFDKNKDGVVDRNDAVITEGQSCQIPGTLTYTCQTCKAEETVTDTEGVSAHTWSEWEAKSGDCSTGILQERVCSSCGSKEQRRVNTDTHQFGLYIQVLPTAQKDGYRIDRCANCGFEVRTELPFTPEEEADEHLIDENIYFVHEKADCRHGEIRRYTCLLCGEMVEREVTAPTDHTWTSVDAVSATCTKRGHSEYKVCLICSATDGKVEYKATGHTDNDADGRCDGCNGVFYTEGGKTESCGCICHNDGILPRLLHKLLVLIWKIFKINSICACGAVHY